MCSDSPCSLLNGGRDRYEVGRLGQTQHHGLHSVLGTTVKNILKLYSVQSGKFTCPSNQIEAVQQFKVTLTPLDIIFYHPMSAMAVRVDMV